MLMDLGIIALMNTLWSTVYQTLGERAQCRAVHRRPVGCFAVVTSPEVVQIFGILLLCHYVPGGAPTAGYLKYQRMRALCVSFFLSQIWVFLGCVQVWFAREGEPYPPMSTSLSTLFGLLLKAGEVNDGVAKLPKPRLGKEEIPAKDIGGVLMIEVVFCRG